MHRTIEASVPGSARKPIVEDLLSHPYVVGLNVIPGAAQKPVGDTLVIHVLNRGADDVLKIIQGHTQGLEFSIVTSEVASISDSKHQKKINHDVDEAIWEEMETGLRHNGRPTPNYLILMFIGGIISTIGFVSEIHDLIIAFIAASIIAPGLEPIAKIPLGIALRKKEVFLTGLKSSFLGYFMLIVASWLTFMILLELGLVSEKDFTANKVTEGLLDFNLKDIILSFAASAASIVMYLSYRRNVIAGPLIALIVIPAASAIGMTLYLKEWNSLTGFARNFGVEMGIIIVVGILFIVLKQKTVHRRRPLH